MARNGKIAIENLSGGELTSAPLLATPGKYSRLLQNFYINSEGHIKKVPGWSAVSQQLPDVRLLTGIDFKKSDGTSIKLVAGRYSTISASKQAVFDGISTRLAVFTGTGTNDLTTNTAYFGSGDAVFTVEVAQGYVSPQYDIWRWKKDSGAWNYFGGTDPLPATINLSDGVTISIATSSDHTTGDAWVITCHNPHIDDLSLSGDYTGSVACTFDVFIDAEGTPDTFKWRKDAEAYTSGVAITGVAQLLSDGISVVFAATTGHSYSANWSITASPTTTTGAIYRLDSGNLSPVKSDFASILPLYMAQMGDIIVAANNVDRPVAYDGSTIQNLNLPFGNSTTFTGTGLNDFTATIAFTYESAVYEVEIDAVAIAAPTVTFTGVGGHDDVSAPSPNYSGAVATANFDIEIDATGAGPDTIKYNVNGGTYVTGQELTTDPAGLDIGAIRIKASSALAHNSEDIYEFKVVENGTPDKFQWRKNGGAWSADINCVAYPTYAALDADYSISFESATGNTVDDVFAFQVDGATNPDTFKWRKDAEAYTSGVAIASGDMTLKEGVKVRFKYFTGHAIPNAWTFDVARDTVTYSKDGVPVATGEVITGANQTIQAGVQFKFNAINGHTLGDKWTMPVDQSVRFGKLYPYKNRMWTIGSDKLTVYYSDLLLPKDFTSTGAGYLDFRYVIPEGDELLDLSSVLNYIAFFFRNHIVVYSGVDPTATGDFAIYQNIAGLGVVATNCVVQVGSDIFFLTPRGIKGLQQVINAGALNVNNVSSPVDADVVAAIAANTSGVYASAHYQKLGLVMFLIGTTIFVFNYQQKAWSRIVIPSANDVSKVLSMFSGADGSLYMGGYDYLFQFDPAVETFNFNGQAPAYRWTSAMWKTTTAESMFFNELLMRLASSQAVTFTAKIRAVGFDTGIEDQAAFNQQTITIPAITTGDAVFNFARIPLYGAGRYIQIDLTENPTYDVNADVEIASAEVHGELGIL